MPEDSLAICNKCFQSSASHYEEIIRPDHPPKRSDWPALPGRNPFWLWKHYCLHILRNGQLCRKANRIVTEIINELFATLSFEATVRDVRLGLFHTGVLTRNCGLAATLPRNKIQESEEDI
jgi:hypothetical protein